MPEYISTQADEMKALCREVSTLAISIAAVGRFSASLNEIGETLPIEQVEKTLDQISQLEDKLNQLGGWLPSFARGM